MPAIDSGGGHVRLRLDIAYDGTEFAGWAAQVGQRTVAGVLDDALSTVFRVPVVVRAAGRTDTGVHATGQVAHVDVPADALAHAYPRTPATGEPEFLPLVRRLADSCPTMSGCARSPAPQPDSTPGSRRCAGTTSTGCRPRRTASSRSRPGSSRRGRGRSTSMRWPRRREHLLGLHDFAAFCRHRDGATTIRELQRLDWVARRAIGITAYVTADAFCWNMVRSLVGALLAVGEGRRDRGLGAAAAGAPTAVQRFRRRPRARADPGRGGLPARRQLAARTW